MRWEQNERSNRSVRLSVLAVCERVLRMNNLMDQQFRRLTASGIVFRRPCVIFSIGCIGTGAATNVFKLYNGFDTADRQVMTLGGIQYAPDFRNFSMPMFMSKGVYIDFTTNGTECIVQFAEVSE